MFAGAAAGAGKPGSSQPSMLDLEFAELSDVGRVRDHNEDYSGHVLPASRERRPHARLALCAGRWRRRGRKRRGGLADRDRNPDRRLSRRARGEAHTVLMPRLVQSANTRIYELGRAASPGGSRMATTIVACALRYDRVVVAHVGDSRCYLIRRGIASQITRDHTVVAEQVRLGLAFRARSRRGGDAPSAQPLSRQRSFRERRNRRSPGTGRRCAAALLAMACTVPWRARKWARSSRGIPI